MCVNTDITQVGERRSKAVPGVGQGGGPGQPRLLSSQQQWCQALGFPALTDLGPCGPDQDAEL